MNPGEIVLYRHFEQSREQDRILLVLSGPNEVGTIRVLEPSGRKVYVHVCEIKRIRGN